MTKNDKAVGRVLLPVHAAPTKYDVQLKPDMVNYTFEGIVNITMATSSADKMSIDGGNKNIVLHAKELVFSRAAYKVIGVEGLQDGKAAANSGLVEAEQVCHLLAFHA